MNSVLKRFLVKLATDKKISGVAKEEYRLALGTV